MNSCSPVRTRGPSLLPAIAVNALAMRTTKKVTTHLWMGTVFNSAMIDSRRSSPALSEWRLFVYMNSFWLQKKKASAQHRCNYGIAQKLAPPPRGTKLETGIQMETGINLEKTQYERFQRACSRPRLILARALQLDCCGRLNRVLAPFSAYC